MLGGVYLDADIKFTKKEFEGKYLTIQGEFGKIIGVGGVGLCFLGV
jgi:hypothetical protein